MTELECKDGVTPPILWIAAAVSRLGLAKRRVTITAGTNGAHKAGSRHYAAAAVDLRTKDFPTPESKQEFVRQLKKELGADYDVIFESAGTANEHCHVEYDPKVTK